LVANQSTTQGPKRSTNSCSSTLMADLIADNCAASSAEGSTRQNAFFAGRQRGSTAMQERQEDEQAQGFGEEKQRGHGILLIWASRGMFQEISWTSI
jgi:hypothetical protein